MRVLRVSLFVLAFFISPLNAQQLSPGSGVAIKREGSWGTTEPGKRLIVHTVKKGEELHLLAGYYLLNSREWYKIQTWNSSVIKNQNRIYPGQELLIYVDNDWQPPYNLDEYLKEIRRE